MARFISSSSSPTSVAVLQLPCVACRIQAPLPQRHVPSLGTTACTAPWKGTSTLERTATHLLRVVDGVKSRPAQQARQQGMHGCTHVVKEGRPVGWQAPAPHAYWMHLEAVAAC